MPLQATAGAATYDAFGGGVTAANYIEDVFSTFLYTGNGSTQTITNGIDLSGKGGLVWIKARSAATHRLWDTSGRTGILSTDTANGQNEVGAYPTYVYGLSNGFAVDGSVIANVNASSTTYVSWSFAEQPKFFDVVTYTGNGSNRTISHSLGSVPGCIIVKRTDTTADWQVYHRSLANTEYMVLNSTAAKATGTTRWNSTTPTSTEFSLGTDTTVNASGGTYVAYLFAHDAGGFGPSGTDNVISCGSWTGANQVITLGYEPQFILWKRTDTSGDWYIVDNMRGLPVEASDKTLYPNLSNAESTEYVIDPTATGFIHNSGASGTYIYIAIRRGPMRTPTSGTSVFTPVARAGTGAAATVTAGFSVDLAFSRPRSASWDWSWQDRLRGATREIRSTLTNAEGGDTNGLTSFASMTDIAVGTDVNTGLWNTSGLSYTTDLFRRAPGFFDVVCYTGTGVARTVNHNLGVAPELWIVKSRSASSTSWHVGSSLFGTSDSFRLLLNTTDSNLGVAGTWQAPTATTIGIGSTYANNAQFNASGDTYVAYLFATVAGVSKVGSYTGTGTTLQVNCGFTAGARFVLIKRTDSTGDWYVWDSARGIVAGNDPYLLLNSTAAEVTTTDYVDTYNAGFEISSTAPAAINANGGTFIFLAVA